MQIQKKKEKKRMYYDIMQNKQVRVQGFNPVG